MIDFKMDLDDAINKPKFHHQWFPDEVEVERDFLADTKKKLEAMGYKIRERSSIGHTEGIRILPNGIRDVLEEKFKADFVSIEKIDETKLI